MKSPPPQNGGETSEVSAASGVASPVGSRGQERISARVEHSEESVARAAEGRR